MRDSLLMHRNCSVTILNEMTLVQHLLNGYDASKQMSNASVTRDRTGALRDAAGMVNACAVREKGNMITSTANARIKNIIKCRKNAKERKSRDIFLVEGIRMFSEIPPERRVETYVTEDFLAHHPELFVGTAYELVADHVMEALTDTRTPQGVLASVRCCHYTLEEVCAGKVRTQIRSSLESPESGAGEEISAEKTGTQACGTSPLLLALEDIQDPGNLGTILRTAEGAGVTGIMMSRDTVDIYNPKVVRSTMGSIFRVPFCYVENLTEEIARLSREGFHTYSAHLQGLSFYDYDYRKPTVFVIGNEGRGLTEAMSELTEYKIRIPMMGKVESLNAATAATVLMYEAMRQRLFK